MIDQQKKYAWTMLMLFLSISSLTFFASDASPLESSGKRIVTMVAEGHNFQGDIIRSAAEIQKEDPRGDDFIVISHLGHCHTDAINILVSQNRQSQLNARAGRNLCISNSCFLI
jgi:hypothetical protein